MDHYPHENPNTRGLGFFQSRGGLQRQSGMSGRTYKPEKLSAPQKEGTMAPTKKGLRLDVQKPKTEDTTLDSTQVTDG